MAILNVKGLSPIFSLMYDWQSVVSGSIHSINDTLVLIYEVYPEKGHHHYYNKNSLCDIDVIWLPRRVDWNAHINNGHFTVLVSGSGRSC